MRTKLIILFIAICAVSNAQNILYSYDSKEIKGLLASTVYLVQSGDQAFDSCMASSMKKCWTLTPYKIISMSELGQNIEDDSKYFIACMALQDGNFAFTSPMKSPPKPKWTPVKIPESTTAAGLCLFHGDKHYKTHFTTDDLMTSSNFPFFEREYANISTDYVIKNLNDNIKIVVDNQLDPVKHMTGSANQEVGEDFSSGAYILKERTLLIPDFFKDKFIKEKVIQSYKYKYQYASLTDIISMITTNPDKYCFWGSGSSIEVFDPVTKSKIYCYSSSERGLPSGLTFAVNNKMIEMLNEAISAPPAKKKKK